MFKVAFVTLGTALVFAAGTAAAQSGRTSQSRDIDPHRYRPEVHQHDRYSRYDRRDIRNDNRDIRRDRRDIRHDRRMLMRYRARGDWNGIRRVEGDIHRDRRDIARDRHDRYRDRRD